MRIPTHHDRGSLPDDRSMTSMIDVVFLLLIFFVCASIGHMREILLGTELTAGALTAEEYEKVDKPLGDVTLFLRRGPAGKTEVQVGEGGTVFKQGDAERFTDSADFDKLVARLRQLAKGAPEIPVILDVGGNVEMGDTLPVFHACKAAKFQSINFATDSQNAFPETEK